jgi:hypothetical protein
MTARSWSVRTAHRSRSGQLTVPLSDADGGSSSLITANTEQKRREGTRRDTPVANRTPHHTTRRHISHDDHGELDSTIDSTVN